MNNEENNRNKQIAKQYIWKKLPLKVKLIIIGGGFAFFLLFFFLIVMFTPLMAIGIIDIDGASNSSTTGISYKNIDTTNTFLWPIGSDEVESDNGKTYALGEPAPCTITSYATNRLDPFGSGEVMTHGGVDISPTNGPGLGNVNVIAAKDGQVIYPYVVSKKDCSSDQKDYDCGGGYGNFVMIQHDDGTTTLYAHMYENTITVNYGDTVKAGQVIGKMGSSGQSTGMHLHFEVRVGGQRVDPMNYISEENKRPKKQTSSFVEGNENTQTVCLTLKEAGYSDVAVAAIMGNIKMESGFNPEAINYIDCIGLVQWCYGRANNLKNTYGENWKIISNQLEFILYELDNSESAAKKYLIDDSIAVRDMAHKFCNGYERPGTSVCNQTDANHDRMGAAEAFLPYVQNECS